MTQRSLAEVVGRTLSERDLTLATSESLTGGLLGATVTGVPGASRYYVGGVVVYATEQKARIGGVDPAVLRKHGVISEQTAVEMVMGVQKLTGADYALAASGVAGPAPQEGHQPGEVWIAVIGRGWEPCSRGRRRCASSSRVSGRRSASRPCRPRCGCCWICSTRSNGSDGPSGVRSTRGCPTRATDTAGAVRNISCATRVEAGRR